MFILWQFIFQVFIDTTRAENGERIHIPKGCLKGYFRDRVRVMELLIGGEFLSYPSLIGQLKKGYPFRHPFRHPKGYIMYSFSFFGSLTMDVYNCHQFLNIVISGCADDWRWLLCNNYCFLNILYSPHVTYFLEVQLPYDVGQYFPNTSTHLYLHISKTEYLS